jgi:toxin YoeB
MARKIIWSLRAQNDRRKILEYWILRNQSKAYSKKLNGLFNESVKILSAFPRIGKPTEFQNVRVKIIQDYLMFYEVIQNQIHILTIWDSRQDPGKIFL